jgi:hypothetical protein
MASCQSSLVHRAKIQTGIRHAMVFWWLSFAADIGSKSGWILVLDHLRACDGPSCLALTDGTEGPRQLDHCAGFATFTGFRRLVQFRTMFSEPGGGWRPALTQRKRWPSRVRS